MNAPFPSQVKPFPWKCGHCGARAVVLIVFDYSAEIHYEGRDYMVHVPDLETPRCESCGELLLDDAANRRISAAFRQQAGLLAPSEIRTKRESLELTQSQVADLLGTYEETLARWESGGQIQPRAVDRLLRLFFASPAVRASLALK